MKLKLDLKEERILDLENTIQELKQKVKELQNQKLKLNKFDEDWEESGRMTVLQENDLMKIKEQLIQILEIYDAELRFEYELLEIDDALLKVKQLMIRMKSGDLSYIKPESRERGLFLKESQYHFQYETDDDAFN